MERFNTKEAIDLVLQDIKVNDTTTKDYSICGTPKEVSDYLKKLGFEYDYTDCVDLWTPIRSFYTRKNIRIIIVWNGWTGEVSVRGCKLYWKV